MARQAARRKQDNVHADIFTMTRITRCKLRCRCDYAAQAIAVNRMVKIGGGPAAFHLDKSDDPPAPGDNINLPGGHPHPLPDNPPAMQTQPPCGQAFRAPPFDFRLLAFGSARDHAGSSSPWLASFSTIFSIIARA